ncbi:hypothetical protein HN51_035127 [Arachis hypogaea]|uniref:Uncharacterized protein n=2 Tax=Arachis TaxID=3817 RepID=A0A445A5T1_ARAHY|nr:uncharacterized protein LOC112732847 [Arachis hypogaea]QHO00111.1 uncharacterized protein DS421_13g403640 [Arachis hypogaea]RYR21779.1 hypothetical protein Ahy_B03g067097 [Arachis hypogaea]
MARKGLRMCMIVCSIFLIVVVTIILAISLTILKPKDPDISVHPYGLENFQIIQPNVTAVPLGMVITIVNPNYGTFNYKNTTGYLSYHDINVAKAVVVSGSVPARGLFNITTVAGIMTQKLMDDTQFWSDIEVGTLNFEATITLPGKVTMLKIFKKKALVHVACDLSFKLNLSSIHTDSSCISKIKL